jgi:hypothetical protein
MPSNLANNALFPLLISFSNLEAIIKSSSKPKRPNLYLILWMMPAVPKRSFAWYFS